MSNQTEEQYKKRGRNISLAVHVGILILALMPFLTYPDPPPGQEGILVNLGMPDVGEGEENAAAAEPVDPVEAEVEEVEEEAEPEEVEEEPEPEPREVEKPDPVKEKKVIESEDPEALALKRKKEREAKKKAEADAKKKAEAEKKRKAAEAKRKAEAEAKRKAEADAKKKAEAKNFGKSLGLEGLGKGKGKTGTSGNQGDPNGDPNASKLEGISTGSGSLGGGLGSRGVLRSPKVSENSQKQGKVVLKVCVDKNGKVTSAEFTQRGSTTSDSKLKAAAIRNAKKWQFAKGSLDKQCGTITYNFRVK